MRTLPLALRLLALVGVTYALLSPVPPHPPGGLTLPDKVAHALMFGVLATLAGFAFPEVARWRVVASLVVYGGVVEVAQELVGRTPDLLDLAADALGASAAWLVPRAVRR